MTYHCLTIAAVLPFACVHSLSADVGDLIDIDKLADRSSNGVSVYSVTYQSTDDLKIGGYLLVPDYGADLPCVIYNRGGNNHQDDFGTITGDFAGGILKDVAKQGYVVVASQLRGFGPDADAQNEADKDEFGGRDVDDVLSLFPFLEHLKSGRYLTLKPDATPEIQERVDPSRVGFYAWSRGGMTTYLALRRLKNDPERLKTVKAAVIGAGLSDLFDSEFRRPGFRFHLHAKAIPGYEADRSGALVSRSAVLWADDLPKSVPLLLIHGTKDEDVDVSQSVRMQMALRIAFRHETVNGRKVPIDRVLLIPNADHGLTEYKGYSAFEAKRLDIRTSLRNDWFRTHLAP